MSMSREEFKAAFREVVSSEFAHIPTDESSIDFTFSEKFIKRMDKLIRAQRKSYYKFINTAAKRAAVIFAAIITLFTASLSVKAIREPVVRFVKRVYETFIHYSYTGDKTEKIEREYTITNLPYGFKQTNKIENDVSITTEFKDDLGNVIEFIKYHLRMTKFSLPSSIRIIDIIQILLIAIFVYYLMVWIKNTRAYTLLKGVLIVSIFLIIAAVLRMDTILWICQQLSVVAITGVLIIFQPELRRALEQLGEKKMLSNLIPFDSSKQMDERITDRTIGELIHAAYAMGEVKTGALIVVEQNIILQEYEKTGIAMDSLISSQLLINIFEHNTPLHDGAVIVRNNRIVSATCYLPLSDNLELNKSLGTRHRAGVGISEVSDALTIIVSEETGKVSYTYGGKIVIGVTPGALRERLNSMKTRKDHKETTGLARIWKGRAKHEEKTGK